MRRTAAGLQRIGRMAESVRAFQRRHDDRKSQGHEPDSAEKRDQEHAEAEERSAPKGSVVYDAIKQEGEDELERSIASLAWSGLAAGLSMGFSFVSESILRTHLPESNWRMLITKLGYGVGFLIVVLGRQQLFTENTLTVILPLLRTRRAEVLWNVARLWAVVLAANLVGALLFATALGRTPVFGADVHASFSALGAEAMKDPFWTVAIRAVFAGWLIALMVWLLPFAETSRLWVIVIVTYIVGIGQFAHVIAGSVATLYLVVTGQRSAAEYITGCLAPSLVGNIVGGVSLVAALAHAQFVAHEAGADA
jgi:formate/nitrite transporter FocA (FNT family)